MCAKELKLHTPAVENNRQEIADAVHRYHEKDTYNPEMILGNGFHR
jgi:hypothetical protein